MKLREKCPFCERENERNTYIMSRDFSACRNIMLFDQYDVLKCNNCGLYYAGNIVQTRPASEYYRQMSRYEGDNFVLSKGIMNHYKLNVDVLKKYVPKDSKILDVGCAFGGLLNELKKEGYTNLMGLEPSEKNCNYAKEAFDIAVYQGSWGENEDILLGDEKFDVIIFGCVMEHLLDFASNIEICKKYLNADGYIHIVVPDAELFMEHDDLYQEFSAEHINYFDIHFLTLMMEKYGYQLIGFKRDHTPLMGLGGNMISLWKSIADVCGECNINIDTTAKEHYNSTVDEKFKEYLTNCFSVKEQLRLNMKAFQDRYRGEYYIWGAGTLTAMMVQEGIIKLADVKAVVDANLNYEGLEAYGHKIIQPKKLREMDNLPILIASQYAGEAIRQNIKELNLPNETVYLFIS